jgi:Transglutaminase-like superfamily
MWRRRDFVELRRRSGAERQLLVEATLWLGLARSAILTIPFRWTTRLFALRPGEGDASTDRLSRELAQRIGWALRVASARSPWQSTCLAQALAGTGMLRRRRIPATLSMGVARSADQLNGMEAHAWLSCAGLILTGGGSHEKYNVVARFTLSRIDQSQRCAPPHA